MKLAYNFILITILGLMMFYFGVYMGRTQGVNECMRSEMSGLAKKFEHAVHQYGVIENYFRALDRNIFKKR